MNSILKVLSVALAVAMCALVAQAYGSINLGAMLEAFRRMPTDELLARIGGITALLALAGIYVWDLILHKEERRS